MCVRISAVALYSAEGSRAQNRNLYIREEIFIVQKPDKLQTDASPTYLHSLMLSRECVLWMQNFTISCGCCTRMSNDSTCQKVFSFALFGKNSYVLNTYLNIGHTTWIFPMVKTFLRFP